LAVAGRRRKLATMTDQPKTEGPSLYDRLVAQLRAAGVGSEAPKIGDRLPDFALPDGDGRPVTPATLFETGPLVLSFQRGRWCPYCRAEMQALQAQAGAIRDAGGSLAAITPEVAGGALLLRSSLSLDYPVLCDVDSGVALTFGLVFRLNEEVRRSYLANGLDLTTLYGNASWFLPVPATFVVDRGGTVRFAHVDVDFRQRADADAVLRAIKDAT
jgi:peroxiredoxin